MNGWQRSSFLAAVTDDIQEVFLEAETEHLAREREDERRKRRAREQLLIEGYSKPPGTEPFDKDSSQ